MIKVHVHNCRNGRLIDYYKFYEMKDWCRETFGKNTLGQAQVWRSGKDWHYETVDDWGSGYLYPVFFFSTEQQATWFRMKWL